MQEWEKAKTLVGRIGVGVIGVHPLFTNYVSIKLCLCVYMYLYICM